jgi:hypothetical protein
MPFLKTGYLFCFFSTLMHAMILGANTLVFSVRNECKKWECSKKNFLNRLNWLKAMDYKKKEDAFNETYDMPIAGGIVGAARRPHAPHTDTLQQGQAQDGLPGRLPPQGAVLEPHVCARGVLGHLYAASCLRWTSGHTARGWLWITAASLKNAWKSIV